jgi:hypothetical protein
MHSYGVAAVQAVHRVAGVLALLEAQEVRQKVH